MARFKKPGYTQIPNEIFDTLMPELSGSQFKILCLISRRTLGYQRDCHSMSLNEIARGCGISQQGAMDALKVLSDGDFVVKFTNPIQGAAGQFNPSTYSLSIEDDECQGSVPNYLGAPSPATGDPRPNLLGTPLRDKEVKEKEERKELLEAGEFTPQSPTLDNPVDPETGELLEQNKIRLGRSRFQKKQKPERPHGMQDRLREMRETASAGARQGVSALLAPQRQSTSTPPPQERPDAFAARWNELVPEAPVDPSLMGRTPQCYGDLVFGSRFDDICAAARKLISDGADLKYGLLVRQKEGRYWWQMLLAGELGWMVPKKSGSNAPKPVDGVAVAAQMRAEIKRKQEEKDARAKAADQIPG